MQSRSTSRLADGNWLNHRRKRNTSWSPFRKRFDDFRRRLVAVNRFLGQHAPNDGGKRDRNGRVEKIQGGGGLWIWCASSFRDSAFS